MYARLPQDTSWPLTAVLGGKLREREENPPRGVYFVGFSVSGTNHWVDFTEGGPENPRVTIRGIEIVGNEIAEEIDLSGAVWLTCRVLWVFVCVLMLIV